MAHLAHEPRLINRVRRIGGQVEAVERALTVHDLDDAAILQLVASIRGGVNSLMAELLEDHIRRHVAASTLATGPEASHSARTKQLIDVVRAYLK